MKKILTVSLYVCLFLIHNTSGSMFELTAAEDSFICSDDYAGMNFGGDEYTRRAIGRQNAYTGLQVARSLYKFQAPSMIVSVESAVLRLKVWDNFAGYPLTVALCGAEDDWEEFSVTWNNQPAHDPTALETAYVTQISGLDQDIVMEFDVTDFVSQQIASGDFTLSFMLKSDDEDVVGGVRWFMRESVGHYYSGWFEIPGMAPELMLEATVPEPVTLILLGIGGVLIRKRK